MVRELRLQKWLRPRFPAWLHLPAGLGKARAGLGLSGDPAQSPHCGFR